VTLQGMSNQNERSLDNIFSEVLQLKEKMKIILPRYIVSLKELSQLPNEFEGRFWVSCVEAQMEKVRADYQEYQARAQKAGLYGNLVTLAADILLKAGGMEPVPLSNSLRIGISIHQTGGIKPTIIDDSNKQPDAIIITYEEFATIIRKLKDQLFEGTIIPTSENEIPELIYNLASSKN